MINDKEINDFQEKSGFKIPRHFQNFLKQNNGYSFNGGVILYSLDELEEMNESLQVQMYQPDYMAIGDDGGGLIFLMEQEIDADEIFVVDISDYELETAFCKINGFEDWFSGGCLIPQKVDNSNTESDKNGNIYLVKLPSNGIKDLVKMKQIFGMDIAMSELLKMSKTLPCKLMSNIKYAKVKKINTRIWRI
ncbi:MAG: SMI1/KNR4 family protein [Lachnospiraceae bacterium]|nr:SMI1/KNR4 family protein [Lachnospiraceae bacterium]